MRQKIDIILIHKAKQEDQKAFVKLFNYYYPQIFSYINSIVKDPIESEDLTMIAIEKIFFKLNSYYPFYTFKSWVLKIARNTALDFIRYKRPEIIELDYKLKADIENPEEVLLRKELELKICNAIDRLPNGYRKVIQLHYFEDLPSREISKKLNISPITSRTQLFRARRKLIKTLAS